MRNSSVQTPSWLAALLILSPVAIAGCDLEDGFEDAGDHDTARPDDDGDKKNDKDKKDAEDAPMLEAFKLLVVHNATDRDTGFQGLVDGDPWNQVVMVNPHGDPIVGVQAMDGLRDFGLTELFFETYEPSNDDVPLGEVLSRLAAGTYAAIAQMVGSSESREEALLTHEIPAGPVITSPPDDATGLDASDVVVMWNPVNMDLFGDSLQIVGYEVIVEQETPVQFPNTLARPVLDVHLPADARQLRIPDGFLQSSACYEIEVLAIEPSGNQTISLTTFETGMGCEPLEEADPGVPTLAEAILLIEHNATDDDTGYQGLADADRWNMLTIRRPDGAKILEANARGDLFDFGLTELFFETNEPDADEMPLGEVLARLPAGTYTFMADFVEGEPMERTALLTHTIPAGPELQSPPAGATVDPDATLIQWAPVTQSIFGEVVEIVAYQVIVQEDVDEEPFPETFAQPELNVYLPASATSIEVPAGFLQDDMEYEVEVLAIEKSGNQTITESTFDTKKKDDDDKKD